MRAKRREPFTMVEDRALAGLSPLERSVLIEVLRRARFRGATDPFADTNAAMAAAIGRSPGHFRRGLAALLGKVVPGTDRAYLRAEGNGHRRRLIPYDSPLYGVAAAPTAPGDARDAAPDVAPDLVVDDEGPARRRPDPAASPLIGSKDGQRDVNVGDRGAAEPPAAPPCPPPPQPPPPVDGIDPELAGLTPEQLRARIAGLEAERDGLSGPAHREARWTAMARIGAARQLLSAIEAGPAPAPRVGPPAPPPAPRPTFEALLGRLTRSAGPGPVEEYARFVADTLDDGHSLGCHRKIAREIRAGAIPPKRARAAFRQASGGTARRPGSVYVAACRRLD